VRLAVAGTQLDVVCNDPERNVWKGDYTLSDSLAVAAIVAEARDLSGNEGWDSTQFSAAFIRAGNGGSVVSPDGDFTVRIWPCPTWHDQYVLVMPVLRDPELAVTDGRGSPAPAAFAPGGLCNRGYLVGPSGSQLLAPCVLEWSYDNGDVPAAGAADCFYIEQEGAGPLESYVDPEAGKITAAIARFGLVWLATGSPGSSRLADPDFLAIGPCGPIPFTQAVTLRCEIRSEQVLRLDVFDVAGRHVAALFDGALLPGSQYITWDGSAADGRPAAAGVYVVRAETAHQTAALKIVRMR
jgi:hypothetical protein